MSPSAVSTYSDWLSITILIACSNFHTLTNSCMWGTAHWWSASHFHKLETYWKCSKKIEQKQRLKEPNESWSCFCQVTNFGTMCVFTHKRFKRFSKSAGSSCQSVTLAFSLQVAAQQLYHSRYKSLLSNFSDERVNSQVSFLWAVI